jgi:hypothetical protein
LTNGDRPWLIQAIAVFSAIESGMPAQYMKAACLSGKMALGFGALGCAAFRRRGANVAALPVSRKA